MTERITIPPPPSDVIPQARGEITNFLLFFARWLTGNRNLHFATSSRDGFVERSTYSARASVSNAKKKNKINFTGEWRKSRLRCYNESSLFQRGMFPFEGECLFTRPMPRSRRHAFRSVIFPVPRSHACRANRAHARRKKDIANATRCRRDRIVSDFAVRGPKTADRGLFFKRWKPKRGTSSGKKRCPMRYQIRKHSRGSK